MTDSVDDTAFLALVERIYEAAADPGLWLDFTNTLHQHFPYASVSTLLVNLDGRMSPHAMNSGLPDEFVKSYLEHYFKLNAYAPVIAAATTGDIVSCASALPRDWLKSQTYYNEWLRPAGNLTSGAVLIVEKTALHSMQLSIDLPERHDDLEGTAVRLLARLHPHLSRAFKLNKLLRGEAALQATIETLLRNINAAAFVLDNSGKPTHLNRAAEDLLRKGCLRSGVHGQPRLHRPADQTKLEQAIMRASGTHSEAHLPFLAHSSDGTELIVTVLPLRPRVTGFVLGEPGVLVVVKPKQDTAGLNIEILRSIHGLTLREAQVASQIADGTPLEQIAERLGVSALTARNQLASAMGKMGTTRQAELVAKIAGLRTTFGPG